MADSVEEFKEWWVAEEFPVGMHAAEAAWDHQQEKIDRLVELLKVIPELPSLREDERRRNKMGDNLDTGWIYIVLVSAICSFILGLAVESSYLSTSIEAKNLIDASIAACEESLPRDQYCTFIITSKPEE